MLRPVRDHRGNNGRRYDPINGSGWALGGAVDGLIGGWNNAEQKFCCRLRGAGSQPLVAAGPAGDRHIERRRHPPCTAGRLCCHGWRDAEHPQSHRSGWADLADRSGRRGGIAGVSDWAVVAHLGGGDGSWHGRGGAAGQPGPRIRQTQLERPRPLEPDRSERRLSAVPGGDRADPPRRRGRPRHGSGGRWTASASAVHLGRRAGPRPWPLAATQARHFHIRSIPPRRQWAGRLIAEWPRPEESVFIEIGGAMTDETPPQQIREAAWLSGPCSNSFHPTVGSSSVTTLMDVWSVDSPLHRFQVPRRRPAQHLDPWPQGATSQTLRPSRSDPLNGRVEHAQTSEVGRRSIGKGGLPFWRRNGPDFWRLPAIATSIEGWSFVATAPWTGSSPPPACWSPPCRPWPVIRARASPFPCGTSIAPSIAPTRSAHPRTWNFPRRSTTASTRKWTASISTAPRCIRGADRPEASAQRVSPKTPKTTWLINEWPVSASVATPMAKPTMASRPLSRSARLK